MADLYKHRTDESLNWSDNRERIVLAGRQILRRVLNSALAEAATEYEAALTRGEVIEFSATGDELRALMLRAAQRVLGSADQG